MKPMARWLAAFALLAAAGTNPAVAQPKKIEPAYVVVTHAAVQRSGRLRFALASVRLVGDMAGTPGLLRQHQGIRRFGAEVWTATAWRDKASMASFVRGAGHAAAMRESAFAIIAMSTWHLECDLASMPRRFHDVLRLRAGEVPLGCVLIEGDASASRHGTEGRASFRAGAT